MSPSTWLITAALVAFSGTVDAGSPSPFSLPVTGWGGIDGNWSTVGFSLGSDSQEVDVLVSTALSEFWVVGTGGCYPEEPHCSRARGGLYDALASDDWLPLGSYGLGLDHLGYDGVGQYGLDSIQSTSHIQKDASFSMDGVLMSAVNTTDYFLGQFGVGITQGDFGNGLVAESPLTMAVKDFGLIPSYSYGYTAGAYYRNMPASVTLGGFDTARFEDHRKEFTVSKEDNLLRTLVRGIEVEVDGSHDPPEDWGSDVRLLSEWDDSFTAVIDTSTPFLWLPDAVGYKFADALGLTYSEDLELYTLKDDQYREYSRQDSYTFTFSLSSTDHTDDLGDPLNTSGVVNITLPIQAFISTVKYPFHQEAVEYGSPAVPYFSLKTSGDNATFVIGRSFLQESYLVTQFDKGIFSIHQAKFPGDPNGDADIVAIDQPPNSPYPPPRTSKDKGLGKGAIAGIVIGASAAVVLCIIGWWCCRRRKSAKTIGAASDSDMDKASAASSQSGTPQRHSRLGRILSKMVQHRRTPGGLTNTRLRDKSDRPVEAPDHEIYELPAPIPPAELTGDNSDDTADDEVMMQMDRRQISPYEQARWKIDRQLAGPVPAYSPPEDGVALPPEKSVYDYERPRPVPTVEIQPLSPQALDSSNSGSLQDSTMSAVSPITPAGNGPMHWSEPSPIAMTAPPTSLPSPGYGTRSLPRSDSTLNASNTSRSQRSSSPSGDPPSSFTVQRRQIDASRVVCLGPLPEGVQLPNQGPSPQAPRPDGYRNSPPTGPPTHGSYEDTLGSNYTEEEARLAELAAQARECASSQEGRLEQHQDTRWPLQTQDSGQDRLTGSTRSDSLERMGRLDGMEFVHVPQPAEKRYSWEEDTR